jgi:hypothetical protein
MNHVVPSRLLQTALAFDAATSGVGAFLQIMYPHLAARELGAPFEAIIGSSVVLGAYAAAAYVLASGVTMARALVALVLAFNVARAAGCLALIGLVGAHLPPLGKGALLAQAVTALAFAAAQAAGLKASRNASRTHSVLAWKGTL